MLHLKACAKTRSQRFADYLLIVFGVVATVYTSTGTIRVRNTHFVALGITSDCMSGLQLMLEPATGEVPQYGRCAPPEN